MMINSQNISCRVVACFRYGLWLVALVVMGVLLGVGCSSDDSFPEPIAPDSPQYISMGVNSVGAMQHTRAIIDGKDAEAMSQLEAQCTGRFNDSMTDLKSPTQQCIRLWGSYVTTSPNSLTNVFIHTPLIFNKEQGQGDNFYKTGWNYPSDVAVSNGQPAVRKQWISGATYTFRAVYPGNLKNMPIECLSAASMNIQYSTQILQEDVMVASGEKQNPVGLDFQHILSAVKFNFRYKHVNEPGGEIDGLTSAEDFITSCWLENTASDNELSQKVGCFATVGTMTYGQGKVGASDTDRELKYWLSNLCERSMYLWKPQDGVRFYNDAQKSYSCTAYTTPSTTNNDLFSKNSGWVLIIPQYVHRHVVELCFTTRLNGTNVYRVPLNALVLPDAPQPQHIIEYQGRKYAPLEYKHGCRYTYTVIFRRTDIHVHVDVAPWNKIDISDEIIF